MGTFSFASLVALLHLLNIEGICNNLDDNDNNNNDYDNNTKDAMK